MMSVAETRQMARRWWNWLCKKGNRLIAILALELIVLAFVTIGRYHRTQLLAQLDAAREQGRETAAVAMAAERTAEQHRAEEAAQAAAKAPFADGTTVEAAQREAEYAAKVLYPVRDNTRAGQKLNVWCIINRVSSAIYANSIEEVCCQDKQWMGFDEDNPVLQDLYDIAYEEIAYWHDGGHLPMSGDHVFLAWTPDEITLRTSFDGGGHCHYFYESDWTAFEAARDGAE